MVNPSIHDFSAFNLWYRPLGAVIISEALRRRGCRIETVDCLDPEHPGLPSGWRNKKKRTGRSRFYSETISKPASLADIPRKFKRYGAPIESVRAEMKDLAIPDAVLITSGMTYWYPGIIEVVELVKEIMGDVPVVLGGVYPTLCPEHASRVMPVDHIIRGPGEEKIFEALEILGIGVPQNEPEERNRVPLQKNDCCFVRKDYLVLLTRRGCPYRCPYCASNKLFKGVENMLTPKQIKSAVNDHYHLNKNKNAVLYDDAFLYKSDEHAEPVLKKLLELPFRPSIHSPNALSARDVNPAIAQLMFAAGFENPYLSIPESPESLNTAEGLRILKNAVECLQRAGYRSADIHVYILTGEPEQEFREIRDILWRVHFIGANPEIAFYSPIPGTPDGDRTARILNIDIKKEPLLTNKAVSRYFHPNWTPEQFQELQNLCRVFQYATSMNVILKYAEALS